MYSSRCNRSCLTRVRHIGLIVTTAPRTGDDNNWDEIITTLIVGGHNGDLDEKKAHFPTSCLTLPRKICEKENLSNKRELESWKWQKSSIMKVKVNVKVKSDK